MSGSFLGQRVSEPKKTCRDSGDALDTVNDVRTHVEHHHIGCGMDEGPERLVSEPEPKEICGKCGDVFRRTADLQTHVQRYHEKELEVENTRRCETSLEQGLRGQSAVRAMEEPYICEVCDDDFATDADLEKHMEAQHAQFECCMFCPFRGSKIDLVAHVGHEELDTQAENYVAKEPEVTAFKPFLYPPEGLVRLIKLHLGITDEHVSS